MKMLISQTELDSKRSRDLIPLECYQCGKTHYRTKNIVLRILKGKYKNTLRGCFCSYKCKFDYRSNWKLFNCKQCNKEIRRTPSQLKGGEIFCSRSCSAKYNNKSKIIMNNCLNCQKLYHPYRGSKKMKYCSHKCQWEFYKKEKYKKILDTNGNGIHKNALRKFLIETRGQKCEICGITEWLKKPLVVIMDHIDGHHENNALTNLRLVCSNCDANLPTYKSKNKGNGRTYRRVNGGNAQCCPGVSSLQNSCSS